MKFVSNGIVPSNDVTAEAAVISAVILDNTALAKIPELRPEHFYSEAHRQIFEACTKLHDQAEPIDVVTVARWLKDHERLEQVGGMRGLGRILDATPAPGNVAGHARLIRKTADQRALRLTIEKAAASVLAPIEDIATFVGHLTDSLAAVVSPASRAEPWYVVTPAPALAEPLPGIEWMCPGLRLARESVTILGGYGYARKTLYAQSLALAIASGTRALGVYSVTQHNVLHIDYEQGARMTGERYQRMARAAGVRLGELVGPEPQRRSRLSTVVFPRLRLTSPGARDHLRRLLEETDAALVIIDSLRASISGVDENSSEIREYIDLLGQECKRVRAAALIIHHARKPTDQRSGDRYSLRGSGAIFDAGDELFMLSGEKGEPTTVTHEKDRLLGSELGMFGLDAEDVARDGDPRWGLRVLHLEPEQVKEFHERKERRMEEAKERKKARTSVGPYGVTDAGAAPWPSR